MLTRYLRKLRHALSGPTFYAVRNVIAPSAEPANRRFGWDRGTPIDRVYIDAFLGVQAKWIRGSVLEIGDRTYTTRFGNAVTNSDVLHAVEGNAAATIVGDLVTGRGILDEAYDCVILTQTLPFVADPQAAVRHAYRSLRSGGALLATVAGLSQISRYDEERWGDFWRFMPRGCQVMFEEQFGSGKVEVVTFGNVYCATRFLEGFCAEDVPGRMLQVHDPEYPVIIGIVAIKQ